MKKALKIRVWRLVEGYPQRAKMLDIGQRRVQVEFIMLGGDAFAVKWV